MMKDLEETQHELEVAVSQALRWFDSRRHPYKSSDDEDDEIVSRRRLYLDFRHLVISHGVDVEALTARIRAKVPSEVPIYMSLQCCRMDDGGLEVMDTFLRNLPNVTCINVTMLWFDYREISNVVRAANDLKKLELPIGTQTGISQVLRACNTCQLQDLRLHASGTEIDAEIVREVMQELPSLKCLKSISFISFKCSDECFQVLCSYLLSNLPTGLDKIHLSCEGGIDHPSLPCLSELISGMPSTTELSIRIRHTPGLFYNAPLDQIENFMTSLRASHQSLKWLELDHVGLTSWTTTRLFRALESPKQPESLLLSPPPSSPSVVVSLCGPFLLRGKSPFRQLVKSLPRMLELDCLAVIDTHCNLDQVVVCQSKNGKETASTANHEELVSHAIYNNPVLQHLSLRIGDDSVYPSFLDEVFDRNASLTKAHKTIATAFTNRKEFPLSMWPHAMAAIGRQGGRYGADPIYKLLEHFFTTQT